MSEADLIKILIACNGGLLALFLHHLVKCRDTRVDIAVIKGSIASISSALARLENRRGDER